jgi:hypothetical protein
MSLKYKNGTQNITLCCLTMIGSLLGQCNSLGIDIVGGGGWENEAADFDFLSIHNFD